VDQGRISVIAMGDCDDAKGDRAAADLIESDGTHAHLRFQEGNFE